MSNTRRILRVTVAAVSLALACWASACGGEAIVDDVGGAGGSSASSSGDGSPICYTPAPSGTIGSCSSSGGAFGPDSCVAAACDEAGNQWMSECDFDSCNCYFNGALQCTCLAEGPLGTCADCCPVPW